LLFLETATMMLLKLADEVYELQGWEPPAKKPTSIATTVSATRTVPGVGSQSTGKSGVTTG
jgi:hypothetical protein